MKIKVNKYLLTRYTIFTLLLNAFAFSIKAQDAVYSQYMFDALSVNPGLTGINDYYKLTVGFRDQWVQISHAYVTYFASYDQKIELYNSGIGFQLYRDVDGGVYSRTSGDIFYSYQFQLANDLVVSPGLQISLVQRSLNISGLILSDRTLYLGDNRSVMFPDFGFGVAVNYSENYSFGLAMHHLNAPLETLSEIDQKRTPMSFSAHYISYFPFTFGKYDKQQLVFSPGVYFRNQQYQNYLQLGLNVAYDPVFVGLWMRASAFKPEAAIFMIGIEHYDFRIVYNFDYKLANYAYEFPGTGAHEIVLTWKFHPKKQWRAIKCSKFSLKNMSQKKKY